MNDPEDDENFINSYSIWKPIIAVGIVVIIVVALIFFLSPSSNSNKQISNTQNQKIITSSNYEYIDEDTGRPVPLSELSNYEIKKIEG